MNTRTVYVLDVGARALRPVALKGETSLKELQAEVTP